MTTSIDPIDPKEATEAKLCAYLEDELPPNERAEIEQHLAANPQHRQLLLDLGLTREWMRAIPMETSPVDLAEIVQGQNERSMLLDDPSDGASPWKTRWPQMVMLAAMVLLVVGLGILVVGMLKGPKSDSSKTFSLAPASTTPPAQTQTRTTDEMDRMVTAKPADQPAAVVTPLAAAPLQPVGGAAPTSTAQIRRAAIASAMGGHTELKMPAAGVVTDTAASDEIKAKLLETGYHLRADEKSVGFVVTADSPATTVEQLQEFFSRHQLAFDSPTGTSAALAQLDRPLSPIAAPVASSQPVLMNSPAMNNLAFAKALNSQNDQLQQIKTATPIIATKELRLVQNAALPSTMPVEPVIYVAHGLTPLQVELLAASLETDNQNQAVQRITLSEPEVAAPVVTPLPAPAATLTGTFNKGQTLSVTVAQLVGPGIEKTNVVRISDDGTIALPMVDPIPAAGASPVELQQRIAQKYKEANLIPEATVTVADIAPTTEPIESGGISTTLPTTQAASQPAATEPAVPVPAPAPTGPAPAPAPTGPVPAPAPVSPGISVVVLVEKSTPALPAK